MPTKYKPGDRIHLGSDNSDGTIVDAHDLPYPLTNSGNLSLPANIIYDNENSFLILLDSTDPTVRQSYIFSPYRSTSNFHTMRLVTTTPPASNIKAVTHYLRGVSTQKSQQQHNNSFPTGYCSCSNPLIKQVFCGIAANGDTYDFCDICKRERR